MRNVSPPIAGHSSRSTWTASRQYAACRSGVRPSIVWWAFGLSIHENAWVHRPSWKSSPRARAPSEIVAKGDEVARALFLGDLRDADVVAGHRHEERIGEVQVRVGDIAVVVVAETERQAEPIEPLRREHRQVAVPERVVREPRHVLDLAAERSRDAAHGVRRDARRSGSRGSASNGSSACSTRSATSSTAYTSPRSSAPDRRRSSSTSPVSETIANASGGSGAVTPAAANNGPAIPPSGPATNRTRPPGSAGTASRIETSTPWRSKACCNRPIAHVTELAAAMGSVGSRTIAMRVVRRPSPAG